LLDHFYIAKAVNRVTHKQGRH